MDVSDIEKIFEGSEDRDDSDRQEIWNKLTIILDEIYTHSPNIVIEWIPKINEILSGWADHLREMPERWLRELFGGRREMPFVELVRSVRLDTYPLYKERRGNNLRSIRKDIFQRIVDCPELASVTILSARRYGGSSHLSAENLDQLSESKFLVNLEQLNLNLCHIGDEGAKIISGSPVFSNLTHLWLFECSLTARGVESLAQSDSLGELRFLSFYRNNIGTEGLGILAKSPNLRSLSSLNVQECRISASGARQIAQSPNFPHLRELDISYNRIGDRGMTAIAHSDIAENLDSLDVRADYIGDQGVIELANSERLSNLKFLALGLNDWGKRGAMALSSPRSLGENLETLWVDHVKVGNETAHAIVTSPSFRKLKSLKIECDDQSYEEKTCRKLFEAEAINSSEKQGLEQRLSTFEKAREKYEINRDVSVEEELQILRRELQKKSSEKVWRTICSILDETFDKNPAFTDEKVVPEVEKAIKTWDEALLLAPDYWVVTLFLDRVEVPMFRLVRAVRNVRLNQLTALVKASSLSNIRSLHIDGGAATITEDHARLIAESSTLKNLAEFHVEYVRDMKDVAPILASSQFIPGIKKLRFIETGLMRAGLRNLLDVPTALTHLEVRKNKLGDNAIRDMCEDERSQSLKSLILTRVRMTDRSARDIANCPYFSNLEELDISDNEVTLAGYASLSNSDYLPRKLKLKFAKETY